jgi:hypothetical protein
MSDDKAKIELYNSLGKCKLEQINNQERDLPLKNINIQVLLINEFSSNKRLNVLKNHCNLVIKQTEKLILTWE